MKKVTIGLVQTSVSDNVYQNLQKTLKRTEEAARNGAKIICLQELFRTTYFPQHERCDASCFAETIPGESTDAFSALAKAYGVVVIVPLFERGKDGKYYNSVSVIDADGTLLPTYRKSHIPQDPLFYEKNYFSPGDKFQIYDTRYARFAVLICYDQWFPEAARAVALNGADIIFYPTAIGWIRGEKIASEGDWRDAWLTVQRGHAIANGVHVAAVNRVGQEGDLTFWGSSFICDSFGKVVEMASDEREETLVARINLRKNKEVQQGWGFFRNRRPEAYTALIEPTRREHSVLASCSMPAGKPCRGEPCGEMTPSSLGYHMPAEWERHDAIWLAWPYDLDSFPEIDSVEKAYLSIVKEIHTGEFVNLLVKDDLVKLNVADMLKKLDVDTKRVKFHFADYSDVWFRDYGPTFVVNRPEGELAMVNWIFNAWGEKYPELMGDDRIPCVVNEDLGIKCFEPGVVMEGGSIEVNGLGTVITTEQCLLNKNRNPDLSKDDIERRLKDYLGAKKVIWLNQGIAGDDTDGHVDDIARFVNPTTVLCAYEDDESDENYDALKENYDILAGSSDQDGMPLEVIKLPMPGFVGKERRLPASYANFYISNEAVLVPIFGHKNDDEALRIIQMAFPNRKVAGIRCEEMVHGLGTIHCISQQQPSL